MKGRADSYKRYDSVKCSRNNVGNGKITGSGDNEFCSFEGGHLTLTTCPVQRNIQWLPTRHQEDGTRGSQLLRSKSDWEQTLLEQDLFEGERKKQRELIVLEFPGESPSNHR